MGNNSPCRGLVVGRTMMWHTALIIYEGTSDMPRYIVQRTFIDGLEIPATAEGAQVCSVVGQGNAQFSVNWVHSYVSKDKTATFCVYDAPSPDAIRQASKANDLPVDEITEVTVLDPYFYH